MKPATKNNFMELKDIAAISGKSGLYKILKPTRTGVIVESMDVHKKKIVVGGNARVSVLKDVSIYTTDTDGSVALEEVLYKIKKEFGDDPGVESTSSSDELEAFMKHILPNYDAERVYPSDMKKLIMWYHILQKEAPEILEKKEETAEKKEQHEKEEKEN